MISAQAGVAQQATQGLHRFIKRSVAAADALLSDRLQFHANKLLDAALSKTPEAKYIIEVDGKSVPDRSGLLLARRRIRITFIERAVKLAVARLKRLMQSAIASNASKQSWLNPGAVQADVHIYYARKGEPVRQVDAAAEIDDFRPGDAILLVPTYGTQMFANASKFGARGFMRKAANSVRSALRINKSSARYSDLRVSAQRSRAVFYKMLDGPAPVRGGRRAGSRIQITVPKPGMDSAWVVAIRLKEQANG